MYGIRLSTKELMLINWCWRRLESPLDSKEIKPVHSKGNQSWIFIGRTDAEAEASILWPPDGKSWLIWKGWCWERLKVGGEGDDEGWDGWMASLTQRTWVLLNWVGDGQGGLACCSPWSCKESDTTEQLNWTELAVQKILSLVRSHLFIFIFVTLKDVLKKMLLQLMSKCVVPLFFS